MSREIFCTCTLDRQGWSNAGAGTEHEWWVHPTCGRPGRMWLESQGDEMLNFFRGGPMDGTAYKTTDLLTHEALALPVIEYKWTPEVIVSETTGASARVWVHHAIANGTEEEEQSSNPAVHPSDDGGSDIAHDVTGGHMSTKSTATLEDRRKSLKLSRGQVAKQSGLTEAKVYRIEKGDSPRTTQEETDAVIAALDALEAAVGDPA